MATIIAFPRDAAMRRASITIDGGDAAPASVTILPVVRIERHHDAVSSQTDTGQDAPPPRGRRRRARQ